MYMLVQQAVFFFIESTINTRIHNNYTNLEWIHGGRLLCLQFWSSLAILSLSALCRWLFFQPQWHSSGQSSIVNSRWTFSMVFFWPTYYQLPEIQFESLMNRKLLFALKIDVSRREVLIVVMQSFSLRCNFFGLLLPWPWILSLYRHGRVGAIT